MGRLPMLVLLATLLVMGLSVLSAARVGLAAAVPAGGTFLDDDANTHESNIEAIAEDLVTQGCVLNTFYCPGDDVTRGQMASFLARAFDLPATAVDFFEDDDGNTHEPAINRIAAAGITLGFPDGTYRPLGTVNREQMGSFLARAMGLEPVPGTRFADVSGVHEPNINAIAGAGVTLGCDPDGTVYCPLDNVRRDQMASFLARATGLVPIAVLPRPTTEEGERLNLFSPADFDCGNLTPTDSGSVCHGTLNWTSDTAFHVRHGFALDGLEDLPGALSGGTRFELHIDGRPLDMVGPIFESPAGVPIDPDDWDPQATGSMTVNYLFVIPGGLTGEHTIHGKWFFDGPVNSEKTVTTVFS